MKNLKNKKGFTLIELIVVIAILGILALFLVPQFMGYSQDAKKQVAQANTRTAWTAANAVLTQSEYDNTIILTGEKANINERAKKQLGEDTFKGTLEITLKDGNKAIDKVTYDGCSYDGESFDGTCK